MFGESRLIPRHLYGLCIVRLCTRITSDRPPSTSGGITINTHRESTEPQSAGALYHLHRRLATASSDPVRLYFMGDSIVEGVALSSPGLRWINLVKDALAEKTGIRSPSDGYTPVLAAGGAAASGWSGSPGSAGTNGLGHRSWQSAPQVSNFRQRTFDCDRLQVFYNRGPAYGAFEVRIDDALVTTVDSYQATRALTAAVWDSGALDPATRTLKLTSIGTRSSQEKAAFAVDIAGVMPYLGNYSRGIQLWEGGHSLSPSWVPTATELEHVTFASPDLVAICYGANDPSYNVDIFEGLFDPSDTAEHFKASADAISNAIDHPVSFVFVATWGKGAQPEASWIPYHQAIRGAAREYGAALVDIYESFGWQGPCSRIADAGTHPNAQGSKQFADVVVRILTGSVE